MRKDQRHSRELIILEGALENTSEAFVTIDHRHRVLFFNRAAEKMFGYPRDEVIGRDLNSILGPECSLDHRKAVRRYLAAGSHRPIEHETELTVTRRKGKRFPLRSLFRWRAWRAGFFLPPSSGTLRRRNG